VLVGIFERAEHADVPIDLVVKISFRQVKAERKNAHQRFGEIGHRLEIFFPRFLEVRDLFCPEIRRKMRPGGRSGEIWIVRHDNGADRNDFLEIAGRFFTKAVGKAFIPDRTIAANLVVLWPLERPSCPKPASRKSPCARIDSVHKRGRDAVSRDHQKPDVTAGLRHRLGHSLFAIGGTDAIRRNIDKSGCS